MATDYILFIHGVNNRSDRERPEYADGLFQKIEREIQNNASHSGRRLEKVALYWGDVNIEAETRLKNQLYASPLWDRMWFREFRDTQLIQFTGDAALYISRYVGSKVVKKLKERAMEIIENSEPDDCLHLVTHSWGTVILFDVLFAGRWEQQVNGRNVPGRDEVMAIRDAFFGISGNNPDAKHGIKLASIHTLGSPIAIFSLVDVIGDRESNDAENALTQGNSHDITPKLRQLLETLYQERQGQKLPWRNYLHPGDPLAYPLVELIGDLVDNDQKYLDIRDIISREAEMLDMLTESVSQTTLALLNGGKAHGSYWRSDKVAQEISKVVLAV
jgi:hypothetical protein